MKRSLSFILTLVMVIGIITSVPVAVSAAGEEVFTFESYGSYCYVSASSTDISGEIIIPSEYNGLPVTGVINFQNCTNITSIVISDGVEEIGWSAFKGCTNLTTVTIGKDVRDTGMGTFTGCNSLTDILVNEDNEYHASQDGVLFNKDKTMLIQYPLGKADKVYTIPDTVTDIFQGAFRESVNLESVIISGSVTTIDPFAFAFSNKLKSVIISDGVQSIDSMAFVGCPELKEVAIPGSVTTIGENTFGYYYSETYELLKVEDFKIFGKKDSAAETYANENGLTFIELKKPTQPTLKKVSNVDGHVKVAWDIVEEADLYRVYRKTGTGSYEYIGSTKNTYFNDKEAGAGKTCRYRIKAKNEAGYSEYSVSLAVKHIDEPTLKSIENSEYGVLIKWDKVTGAKTYSIYRKVSGGTYEYIGVTSNTYYTDKTAESGTKYYYAIRGKRDDSVSSQSESLSKYYLADPTLNTPTSTSEGIGLRWSQVEGAEGYVVYRRTADGSYKRITTEEGVSNVTFRDTTAEKGTKYYYKVKAYYSKTYSAYSNTKAITDKY